jgi:hypothetical protein
VLEANAMRPCMPLSLPSVSILHTQMESKVLTRDSFSHERMLCKQTCLVRLQCGHPCSKPCYEKPCQCNRCGRGRSDTTMPLLKPLSIHRDNSPDPSASAGSLQSAWSRFAKEGIQQQDAEYDRQIADAKAKSLHNELVLVQISQSSTTCNSSTKEITTRSAGSSSVATRLVDIEYYGESTTTTVVSKSTKQTFDTSHGSERKLGKGTFTPVRSLLD